MNSPRLIKRRGHAVVAKILQATLEEIAASGPDRLSLEAVAARAGVNKTSIWRRWSTPAELAIAALRTASDTAEIPDTGSLRGDLLEYLHRFRDVCREPAVLSILRMRFRDEFGNDIGSMLAERFAGWDDEALIMFERAATRGELRDDADIELLRDMLLSTITGFALLRFDWFQREDIAIVIDVFLNGAAPRPIIS